MGAESRRPPGTAIAGSLLFSQLPIPCITPAFCVAMQQVYECMRRLRAGSGTM
jgi:multidrug efflux pump subunit AcrB